MTKLFITVLTAMTVSTVIFVIYLAWIINELFIMLLEMGVKK